MTDEFNGWKNHATWNVALWIGNDEGFYRMALQARSYERFAAQLIAYQIPKTPDNVAWDDPELDTEALNEFLSDL